MLKLVAGLALLAADSFGETCLIYGKSIEIHGVFSMKDEAGYNQFIALRLASPICALGGHKDSTLVGISGCGVLRLPGGALR